MTFSVDPSMHHIAVNETDVLRLFRSTTPVSPPDPYFLGHPCQAYLCSARKGELLEHFIAILDITTKLPLIYRAECDVKDAVTNSRLLADAQDFICSLGFSLEQMDLNYGTAMKQVVIRALRIMRPPEPHRIPPPALQQPLPPPAVPESVTSPAESSTVEENSSIAPPRHAAVMRQPAKPAEPLEQSATYPQKRHLQHQQTEQADSSADLQRVITELQQQLEQANQAREAAETALQQLTVAHAAACAQWEQERLESASQLRSVSNRLERLSAEKKIWDAIAKNFRKKARVTVERLRKEKSALQQELQQLPKRHPGAAAQSGAPVVAQAPVSPFAALGLAPLADFSGFYTPGGGSSADFHYDPAMQTICYQSAEEIIDLYGSGNVIQAAPFERRSQACSAYICVVEQQGQQLIYLAWQLLSSGEVLFCIPAQQPENAASCARLLQDALFYFESVGFMMDRFELSSESRLQLQALEKTGICRQGSAESAHGGEDPLATGV